VVAVEFAEHAVGVPVQGVVQLHPAFPQRAEDANDVQVDGVPLQVLSVLLNMQPIAAQLIELALLFWEPQ
jgi:hypothetical protein